MVRGIASSRTIYVGNLPSDIREREVEDIFYKYGHVVDIDLKVPPRPPGYAFVEFEDARDAEDAIRGRDGYEFDGHRLRVELAHGGGPRQNEREGSLGYRGSGGGRPGGVSRRTEHRVLVTNLPSSASWQDLKDHMRKAGDVCFAQVFREGGAAMGIVDYTNREDMKNAIRKLDDSEFKNPFHKAYIRVKADKSDRSPSRSRSRSRSPPRRARSVSRSRSRSRTRSPPRSRSVSQSPARSEGSPKKSISPTPKRSPSRSRSPSPVPVEEKGMDSPPPIVEEPVPPAEESVLPAENSAAPAEASEPAAEESAPAAEESNGRPAEDPMED